MGDVRPITDENVRKFMDDNLEIPRAAGNDPANHMGAWISNSELKLIELGNFSAVKLEKDTFDLYKALEKREVKDTD